MRRSLLSRISLLDSIWEGDTRSYQGRVASYGGLILGLALAL